MKKTDKNIVDPFKIYLHADRFYWADLYLRSEKDLGRAIIYSLPANVIGAFAAELYLKCLISIESGVLERGHNLKNLFLRLKPATRNRLEELWIENLPKVSESHRIVRKLGAQFDDDLMSAIDSSARAFEDIRYFYEDTDRTRFVICDFPRMLRTVILEKNPAWG